VSSGGEAHYQSRRLATGSQADFYTDQIALDAWNRGAASPSGYAGGMERYNISSIVILTGAGISAESGVATFRGPDGLWEGHRVEDVATPEAFERDPALVQTFYDARRARMQEVEPNPAHRALARLDAQWPGELLIVTQNVDDLHERAGAKRVLHMHGELASAWCRGCNGRFRWEGPLSGSPACPGCGAGRLRPDIVWFGEMPYDMERIDRALVAADLFVSIGTSGAVYPAAGFVQTARYCGARTLEMNLEPSLGSFHFHESRIGRAGELVPAWVRAILTGKA
jgi:NAD-dependent deacetylase